MSHYFTPAAISYLTQFILSATVTIYLSMRLYRHKGWDLQTGLLHGFFFALTAFTGLLFLDATLLPTPRLYVVYLENSVLGIVLVLILQFAYQFPEAFPQRKREARVVLALSLLYTAYEVYYAVYRYSLLLKQGDVDYRPLMPDYALAVLILFVPMVFFRQAVTADERSVPWLRKLWQPQGMGAQRARDFGLTYLILVGLGIINVLRALSVVSATVYNISLSMGILAALWLFSIVYLNYITDRTSFLARISGLTLVLLLAMMGTIGWILAPVRAAGYRPALSDHQTLRFVPNGKGGYDVSEVPFRFETKLGERLKLSSYQSVLRSQPVDFDFEFFGRDYSTIYVSNSGLLRMDQALYHPNLQNNYGSFPGIFPLLVDLEPMDSGGVYARVEAERLVVTWDHVPALYEPESVFTFQTILYHDGSFEITYNGLPNPIMFHPDDAPSTNPWLRGITPGPGESPVQTADLAQAGQIGPQGAVQDLYMGFRQHLNHALRSLAWLVLAGSLLIITGLPLILRKSFSQPLERLVAGIREVDDGNLDVQVPVYSHDEIGMLTQSFNGMVTWLHELVGGLEKRVAERTAELSTANEELRIEIAEHTAAQAEVIAQQRHLAASEEREQLSRGLHDGLGQVFSYVSVQTQAALQLLEKGDVRAVQSTLESVSRVIQDAHADLRGQILDLRESAETRGGFIASLQSSLEKFQQSWNVKIRFSPPENMPKLPAAVEDQILRIILEALVNIRKHAQAQQVDVLITFLAGEMVVMVSDNGQGFELEQTPGKEEGHFGLGIMRERAGLIGARLEVRSAPGKGTQVLVYIPHAPSPASSLQVEGVELSSLRLLLVDDHSLFLEGLQNMLTARGLVVIGRAFNGLEAQEQAQKLRPDIILMDLNMPLCNGLEATRAIKAANPEIKIVILTMAEEMETLYQALQAGASGFMLKRASANEVCTHLAEVAQGATFIPPELAVRVVAEFDRRGPVAREQEKDAAPNLSSQQWKILQRVAQGLTYKEVAAELFISEKTVKYHMGQVLERLQMRNRAQAIAYVQQRGRQAAAPEDR